MRDAESDESKSRTTGALSQAELTVPKRRAEEMPEADRERFHDGVYSGPGQGAAPGNTDVGGADTGRMEEHPKMGTTGTSTGSAVAGGSIDRSSAGSEQDRSIDSAKDNG